MGIGKRNFSTFSKNERGKSKKLRGEEEILERKSKNKFLGKFRLLENMSKGGMSHFWSLGDSGTAYEPLY